jgi:hypothetical protein
MYKLASFVLVIGVLTTLAPTAFAGHCHKGSKPPKHVKKMNEASLTGSPTAQQQAEVK